MPRFFLSWLDAEPRRKSVQQRVTTFEHALDASGSAHTDVGYISKAQGQVFYCDGAQWTALVPGVTGQVLKTSDTGLVWEDAPSIVSWGKWQDF